MFKCHHICAQAIGQTLVLSINVFAIELLVRMFEPHTSNSHLAQFCLPSDPEPCPPHYTSHMIRATCDYIPTCYGSSATGGHSFLRLLSKRNVSKMGGAESGSPRVGGAEGGSSQVGGAENGSPQVGRAEIGSPQVGGAHLMWVELRVSHFGWVTSCGWG